MGKKFWAAIIFIGTICGLVIVKYFKIDAVEARQANFEERTEKRMSDYDTRLLDATTSAKVSEGLLKQIKEDTREIRQYMLDKK